MRDIYIYGTIGQGCWWDEDLVSAKSVISQLEDAGAEDVTLHINSDGGDVFEAVAINAAIRRHPGRVLASIEGIAASAASFVAVTAEECTISNGSFVMVHNPWAFATGGAGDLRAAADRLDKTRDSLAAAYAAKTGRPSSEMAALMDEETWMDASEAVELGFADRVEGTAAVAACAPRMAAMYRHVPPSVDRSRCEPPATIPAAASEGGTAAVSADGAGGSPARRLLYVGGNVY